VEFQDFLQPVKLIPNTLFAKADTPLKVLEFLKRLQDFLINDHISINGKQLNSHNESCLVCEEHFYAYPYSEAPLLFMSFVFVVHGFSFIQSSTDTIIQKLSNTTLIIQ